MTRYLGMLKTDIRHSVSIQRCGSLAELQDAARRREIEIVTQTREWFQALYQYQPAAKRFKSVGQSLGAAGVRHMSFVCHMCG